MLRRSPTPRCPAGPGSSRSSAGRSATARRREAPERLLRRGRTVVGRSRDADLRVLEETVSPRHAALDVDAEGRVVVTDLGALNGVSVDGVPVSEVELHDGNRLQLGDAVLVFRVDPVGDDGGRQGGELGEQEPLPDL